MTPGRILFELYYKPLGVIRRTLKTGIRRTAETNRGRKEMMAASLALKEVIYPAASRFDVYFLTGKQYWFQTAFCLYSLQLQAGVNIHAFVVDDGSFDDHLEVQIKRQFPSSVTIVRKEQVLKLLDEQLPEANYPVLRRRRIEYPHLRKLTDIHVLPSTQAKLVLDSDMLFFQQPVELLHWLANPAGMLFMRDVQESYGYTKSIMQTLTGAAVFPERLNVGVAGISSSQISWAELERWTGSMLKEEGSSYLQEQALTAMIAAGSDYKFLDEKTYKVLPTITGIPVQETLHHYVADSKYDYFVKGWRHIAPNKQPITL